MKYFSIAYNFEIKLNPLTILHKNKLLKIVCATDLFWLNPTSLTSAVRSAYRICDDNTVEL
jgi:hypothetical protein